MNSIGASEETFLQVNNYHITGILGSGNTGVVYLAIQESTGQQVAIKVMKSSISDSNQLVVKKTARFKREMQICTHIRHPNIVQVLDFGELENQGLYTVFEYLPGETLASLLEKEGALPLDLCKKILLQTLEAITEAHCAGIIHRDLKPENIMVLTTSAGKVIKILDFGISTIVPESSIQATRLTTTQEFLGTPAYCAPEQLKGESVTFKADLFSWGLIAVECITGLPAYQERNMVRLVQKMLSSDPVPLPPSIVNHTLGSLLSWVLQKDQQRRAGDASQVLKRFSALSFSDISNIEGYFDNGSINSTQKAGKSKSSSTFISQEKKQIAILSLVINFLPIDNTDVESDLFDEIYISILEMCTSISKSFGGFCYNEISDMLQFYFGYPSATGNETKKAAAAALQIAISCNQRNILLQTQHRIKISYNIGIHTGMVPIRVNIAGDVLLTGVCSSIAGRLSTTGKDNSILLSKRVHSILQSTYDCISAGDTTKDEFCLIEEKQTDSMLNLSTSTSLYFAGRQIECSVIQEYWDESFKKTSKSVFIRGEAGIGKSRLIAEIIRHNPLRNWIELRCTEVSSNDALHPVLDFFTRKLNASSISDVTEFEHSIEDILSCSEVNKEQFISIFMHWTGYISIKYPPLQISPVKQKQLFLNLLVRFFIDYAAVQNTTIIIEDLHWVDATTGEFITELLTCASNEHVFLILTARPIFSHQWGNSLIKEIVLDKLEDEEISSLISNHSTIKITNAIATQIINKADGNPLYTLEILNSITQLLEKKSSKTLDSTVPFEIPDTLRGLLAHRLDMIGIAKETAQIASVIGRWFDYDLLAKISLRDEGTLLADLDQLVSAGMIHVIQKQGALSYVFHHALIKDISYESLTTDAKSTIHKCIATVIENDYPEIVAHQPGILAQHWMAACDAGKTVKYAMLAARKALEKSSFYDTIYYSEMSLKFLQKNLNDDKVNIELSINSNYIQAMMSVYGWADKRVKANAEHSYKLLNNCSCKTLLVPTLWILATYHHVAGNRTDVRRIVNELEIISKNSSDRGLEAATKTISGISYWIDGNYNSAECELKKAIEYYNPIEHRNHGLLFGLDSKVWALAGLANVIWFKDSHEKALDIAQRAVQWAEEINHLPSLGIALMYLSFLHHYNNDKYAVGIITGRLLQLSHAYGLPAVEGYGWILNCWATGNLDAAKETLHTLRQLGCNLGLSYVGVIPAEIEADNHNYSCAVSAIDEAITVADSISEPYFTPELLLRKSEYLIKKNDVDNKKILEILHKAAGLSELFGMPVTTSKVRSLINTITN